MQNRIAAAHRLGSSQLCLAPRSLQRGLSVRPRAAAADEAPTTTTSGSSQQQVWRNHTGSAAGLVAGLTLLTIIAGCVAVCSCLTAAFRAVPCHTQTQITPTTDELVKNLEMARKSASKRLQRRRCVSAPPQQLASLQYAFGIAAEPQQPPRTDNAAEHPPAAPAAPPALPAGSSSPTRCQPSQQPPACQHSLSSPHTTSSAI